MLDSVFLLRFYGGRSCPSSFHTDIYNSATIDLGESNKRDLVSPKQSDIYHVILRFSVGNHDGDAVLDLAGSVGGGEDVVHGKLDGPAGLQHSGRTVRTKYAFDAGRGHVCELGCPPCFQANYKSHYTNTYKCF